MIEIPNTVFGLLCLIITTLAGVVLFQQKRLDKVYDKLTVEKDLRLQDSKEMMREITQVMRDSIQSDRILTEKIEIAKSKGTI